MPIVSDIGPFTLLPRWLFDHGLSDRAVLVYAVLGYFADNETATAYPSKGTIAKLLHTSSDSIERAVKELVTVGAVSIEPRFAQGKQLSNLYTLRRIPPKATARSGAAPVPPLRLATASVRGTGGAPVPPELDPQELDPEKRVQALPGVEPMPTFSPDDLREIWNAHRGKLPECRKLNPDLRRKARHRIKDHPDRASWIVVVKKLAASKVCDGREGRWTATFRMLLNKETHGKALDGAYDWDPDRQRTANAAPSGVRARTRRGNAPAIASREIFVPGEGDTDGD